jgi:hypothetical protein
MKDPLYKDILERLGGELDPQVFEGCACDLLRDAFPSLVPVRGGHDAGMDGAIASLEEEAYPLVCTTREDFHRNLVESLDSFLAHGRRPRKVVFATSQEVTPPQRRRLEDSAHGKGFALVQVVDRNAIAQRLYWSPRWLKELIGLSAVPLALSAVPRSRRSMLDLEPIGREEDLHWIQSTPGDRVLIGEPGSGKTFLFRHLIRQAWDGLFLVDDDRGEIKRALLERKPSVVVVDDAHVRPETLRMLRQMREEMGGSFSIIATTWTWERYLDQVLAELPGAQERTLHLLPRHQILEILRQAGVHTSDDALRDLVDQAANKPGLAATIADLWKRGAWKEILEGKTLRREVLAAFGCMGLEVEDLLAALSLGGDRGISLEAVGRFLHLSLPEARRQASALAAAGVLSEEMEGALSVRPRQLRTALLSKVFFAESAPRLDYRPLLGEVPSLGDAVKELALVQATGTRVQQVRELALQAGCEERSANAAWSLIAESDPAEARWVSDHYPGDLLDVGHSLLAQIPDEVLLRLLARGAEGSSIEARESRAMTLLAKWVQNERPLGKGLEEALLRRRAVALASRRFLLGGGDTATALRGICIALHPSQEWSTRDPGLGNTVSLHYQLLPHAALLQVASLWDQVKDAIGPPNRAGWTHLQGALWGWMHPTYSSHGAPVAKETSSEMRAFAARVLGDLLATSSGSPGLRAGIARLAAQLPGFSEVELDPTFELLFPKGNAKEELARAEEGNSALAPLIDEWAGLEPNEMARRLSWYESEAERIGHRWPRKTPEICRQLAGRVPDPNLWLHALVAAGLAGPLVTPFLERILQERVSGWEEEAGRFLSLKAYQYDAMEAILRLPKVPTALLEKALELASTWPEGIEILSTRGELSEDILRAALHHSSWPVALAAAVGEWHQGQKGDPRPQLFADWKGAILAAHSEGWQSGLEYWLGEILAKDPELALAWLRVRVQGRDFSMTGHELALVRAVEALGKQQRKQLLGEVPPSNPMASHLILKLVGRDPDLFGALLSRPELQDQHLVPLEGQPDDPWIVLALLALAAGHRPEEVATASIWGPSGRSTWGSGADEWLEWKNAFTDLESHSREELRQVGRFGRQICEERLLQARKEEERTALKGF